MIRLLHRTFIDLRRRLWPQFTSSLSRRIKHLYRINWPCRWPNEAVRPCKFPHDCEHHRMLIIIEGFSFAYQSNAFFKTCSDEEDAAEHQIFAVVPADARVHRLQWHSRSQNLSKSHLSVSPSRNWKKILSSVGKYIFYPSIVKRKRWLI